MITEDFFSKPAPNAIDIYKDNVYQKTALDVSLSDSDDEASRVTENSISIGAKSEPRRQQLWDRRTYHSQSILMDGFIKSVTRILENSEKDYLLASESGEIVVKCKSYLNSLMGNKAARRYVASTMLIVRNNYEVLDARKRDKLIEYIHTYYEVAEKSEKINDKLLDLYKEGIRPI